MKGLITPNKLVILLVQEVQNFDIKGYLDIVRSKYLLTNQIKKNNINKDVFDKICDLDLPAQITLIRHYIDLFPRIKRILEILKKSEGRISIAERTNYNTLIVLLNKIMSLVSKKLIKILELQQETLRAHDFKSYAKLFSAELKIAYDFVKPLSKLGVDLPKKTLIKKISKVRYSIVALAFISIIFGIIGIIAQYNRPDYSKLFQECMQEVGIEVGKNNIAEIDPLLYQIWSQDLAEFTLAEKDFESFTGLNVGGDFTQEDLQLAKIFFEKTYGSNMPLYSFLNRIIFLPSEWSLKYLNLKNPECASVAFEGLSRNYTNEIFLLSSSDTGKDIFLRTLAHEIAHQIHFKIGHLTDFNEKWDTVVGGYARPYGKVNRNEDVATVYEEVMFAYVRGNNISSIRPVDRNSAAFIAKVRLLKAYNFLPPQIRVP